MLPDGERLQHGLVVVTAALHPQPERLRSDTELQRAILALYNVSPECAWTAHLLPFLVADTEPLRVLYEEHASLPEAKVLDLIEAPMVLERLRHDSARLQAIWPLDHSALVLLSAGWGSPIYHAA